MLNVKMLIIMILCLTNISGCSKNKIIVNNTYTCSIKEKHNHDDSINRISAKEYIQIYQYYAVKEMHYYNIPASVKLAQAIHESASGNSKLAQHAKNHFGIKCGNNWNGNIIKHNDDIANESFRVYENIFHSYRDHSIFLQKARYSKLFTYNIIDYKKWSYELQKSGYATDSNYAIILIKIIEYYKLYSFDHIKIKE
ncbi:MAG: glucosaminidase domain-containing protein [Bacteroides sp.]|nr:MAG: glucosaminidase domain-containing protein [Bacteroides sp.]